MKFPKLTLLVLTLTPFICNNLKAEETKQPSPDKTTIVQVGFIDASLFGFSPEASGKKNAEALQRCLDRTGTIVVSRPGTYKIAGTVYIGSNTTVVFSNGVFLKKVNESGPFNHVMLNKGAFTKTYDSNIRVEGLQIIVNGLDVGTPQIFGLRGQLAFFYVKDLSIERFRCMDLGKTQYGIHICTFEDVTIRDVIIKGDKDGVHLGRGKRFAISDCVFETYDDAIALNGHDYDTGNPELGWIENGVIQNCHDMAAEKSVGYFCRILAGAWIDWQAGMEVQKSDTVVSNGRLYRVSAKADGQTFRSQTQPAHETGSAVLDGITWVMVQKDLTYTAGVRNVVFRDIFLEKPRTAFSVHFDNDKYSRSYYPGAKVPIQEQLSFDNIRVLYNQKVTFLGIDTPVDVLTITNTSLRNNPISFNTNKAMKDYQKTTINMVGCIFNQKGAMELVSNKVENKVITLRTSSSIAYHDDFTATVSQGPGKIQVISDLPGLKSAQ